MSRTDASRNLVAALSYLPFITVIISIVILLVEKDDKYIRFHALQSFIISVIYYFLVLILGRFPFNNITAVLLVLAFLIIWIISMIKAYQGKIFRWPIVGGFAEKQVK